MSAVAQLHPHERAQQDTEMIAALYRNLGPQAARAVLDRALGEMQHRLGRLSAAMEECRLEDMARQMQSLRAFAETMGMLSLATVAQDLRDCLLRGDSTSFAAIWARLQRLSLQSLRDIHAPSGGDLG